MTQHSRPHIQENLKVRVGQARFDQEEAHRQHAAAREQQMLDMTVEVRDLTKDVRDLTSTIRWLTWSAVAIAAGAFVASVLALLTALKVLGT